MSKTQQEILAEVESKGYAVVAHGTCFATTYGTSKVSFGSRRINAAHQLVASNVLIIDGSGTDFDARGGYTTRESWVRLMKPLKVNND